MAKRPRSKADLADRLCDAVKDLAAERSSRSHGAQWIMLHDVARHLGISDDEAQRAVALAVERGWLTTDGSEPPHSVALNRGLARRLITAGRLVASNTPLLDGVHSLCIPASYKSVRLQRWRSIGSARRARRIRWHGR